MVSRKGNRNRHPRSEVTHPRLSADAALPASLAEEAERFHQNIEENVHEAHLLLE
jgi:hypothetical protein